jgi:endonuclease I
MTKFYTIFFSAIIWLNISAQTEPANQPSNLVFTNVSFYTMNVGFTPTAADGYLVLKSTRYINAIVQDNTAYTKGQGVGNSKVAYIGTASLFIAREIQENTKYYYAVYAYNGSGSNINYNVTNPLRDSITTPASDPGNYYSNINNLSGSFISDLHNLITQHTVVSYTPGYANTILPVIYERDTGGGGAVINCEYSNETTVYLPPFSFTTQAYNREHVLCKSWMLTSPTYGNAITNQPEGADQFNLLLTRSTPNQYRSNNPLGIVVNPTQQYGESKLGTNINGSLVFEPKNNRKGDAARAMMYQMVCYTGKQGTWGLDYLLAQATQQDQAILKLWHQQDPPDVFERTKNEYIFSIQQNRNPFIDHPEWVGCINFDSLIKTTLCGETGIESFTVHNQINVSPNPAGDYFAFTIESENFSEVDLKLYSVTGEIVLSEKQNLHPGLNNFQITIGNLLASTYFLRVVTTLSTYTGKVLVNR